MPYAGLKDCLKRPALDEEQTVAGNLSLSYLQRLQSTMPDDNSKDRMVDRSRWIQYKGSLSEEDVKTRRSFLRAIKGPNDEITSGWPVQEEEEADADTRYSRKVPHQSFDATLEGTKALTKETEKQ